jgi:hypothetical protein
METINKSITKAFELLKDPLTRQYFMGHLVLSLA